MPVPGLEEDAAAKGGGRWRRLRWGLLDRTASLLDMNTLSVFAPVKALLHAFKGNRWVLSPPPPLPVSTKPCTTWVISFYLVCKTRT